MLDAGYRKSTTRLSALVSRNPSPFAARGRLNLFDSKAMLIPFFVSHRYRARLSKSATTATCAVSRKFGEGAVGISMTPKARRHSAFKIKRLVPRNCWKFPRSSVATIVSKHNYYKIFCILLMLMKMNYYVSLIRCSL